MPVGVYVRRPRPLAERFWRKVVCIIGTGCWEWIAFRDKRGYGHLGGAGGLAHRVSWELAHGPIPVGLFVCHHCDNPPCVRPDHLFLGTCAENVRDSIEKHRFISEDRVRATQHRSGSASYQRRRPELVLQGEMIASAKLTWEQVRQIRKAYACGDCTLLSLADEFHTTFSNISSIVHWKTWRKDPQRECVPDDVLGRRLKTHCLNQHAFDVENTGYSRDGNRYCRACATIRSAATRASPRSRAT